MTPGGWKSSVTNWATIALLLLAQLLALAYQQGQIASRVDGLQRDIQEIKQDVRELRHPGELK